MSGNHGVKSASDDLKGAQLILAKAGMQLDKIGSNSSTISEMASYEFGSHVNIQGSHKVLGLKWLLSEDCFSFDTIEFPTDLIITKRLILSTIARLFDPLGFLAPVIMLAKGIFQDLWKLGLNWDSAVPPDIRRVFKIWLSELPLVSSLRIQRSFSGGAWTEVKSLSLHGFGDASVKGYGACVYLVAHLSNRVVSKAGYV